jgi:hypothetical protein
VSFVSEKASILQDLEDADLLWRFVVTEERMGVKVRDTLHQLIIEPSSIEFVALKPGADMASLVSAANIAWERLKPKEVRRMEPEFRFLTSVDATYNDARRNAGAHIIPMPSGVDNVDFAISADLETDDPKSHLQVECGIVEQREARQRLAMHQEALREDVGIAPSVFDLKSIPEVGVFDRQAWRIADLELTTWDDVLSIWSRVGETAEEIDVALFERLRGDAK